MRVLGPYAVPETFCGYRELKGRLRRRRRVAVRFMSRSLEVRWRRVGIGLGWAVSAELGGSRVGRELSRAFRSSYPASFWKRFGLEYGVRFLDDAVERPHVI